MKKFLLIFLFLISAFVVIGFFIPFPVPPKSLQTNCRQALHQAKLEGADQFAPQQLKEAQILFDSAMQLWVAENKKFIPFRDYSVMQSFLERSLAASDRSYSAAMNKKIALSERYIHQIELIKDLFTYFDQYLTHVPVSNEERKKISLARLHFEACVLSIKKDQMKGMGQELTQVQEQIESLTEKSKTLVTAYFNNYPYWEKLQQEALKVAKQKSSHTIIVDKFSRKCLVFDRGELLATYPIELGSNWIGDKQQSGDKTTPEGTYKIVMKKEGGQTKYQKALLLNYPNEEDLKRYEMNKRKGIISKNARTGGDIEIHGMGGKGFDWTDGCIALSNEDMSRLYQMLAVGSSVVIVGSTKPLNVVLGQ
jgi:L,D-peptidoglycan transpeptidase YkuD (ErfK/YbiS/YcfS/YnhG family)